MVKVLPLRLQGDLILSFYSKVLVYNASFIISTSPTQTIAPPNSSNHTCAHNPMPPSGA